MLTKLIQFWKNGFREEIWCYRQEKKVPVYGYTEPDIEYTQVFMKIVKWYDLITVESEEIFTEKIPGYAVIQTGCLGYSDWKSDAPQWMHDAANKAANEFREAKRQRANKGKVV